ncbi:MAG: small multi-drug export protein [bacterium]|nr:small multi-drug export protein [bacterium]
MQELLTFLVAASPLVELRGAIPLALLVYELPMWQAFFLAVAGNMLPVLLLPFFGVLVAYLSKNSVVLARLLAWVFERTRRRHEHSFELFRDFALVLFVAIPLPFTGAWTATLAAFVFGIPFQRAFPLIFFGVIIAGVVVSMITLGFFQL